MSYKQVSVPFIYTSPNIVKTNAMISQRMMNTRKKDENNVIKVICVCIYRNSRFFLYSLIVL